MSSRTLSLARRPTARRRPARLRGHLAAAAAFWAAVFVAACASGPSALVSPELISFASHYAGDPVGGMNPDGATLVVDATAAIEVHATVYVLSSMPKKGMRPLSDDIRMIVGGAGSNPLASSSLVAPGARIATGEHAAAVVQEALAGGPQHVQESFSLDGLVVPGVTTVLAGVYAKPVDQSGDNASERRLSVHVWQENDEASLPSGATAGSLAVALVLSDIVDEVVVSENAMDDALVVRAVPRRERLILESRLVVDGGPLLIAAPARFDPTGRVVSFVVLEARSVQPDEESSDEFVARVDDLRAEVYAAAEDGIGQRQRLEFDDQLRERRLKAIEALSDPEAVRAAIVELGGGGTAPLVTELALMGADQIIEDLSSRLVAMADDLRALAGDQRALAWRLEREAISLFAEASLDEGLPSEYDALLLRYTGEAGRYPGTIEDALAASTNVEEFYTRIFDENRIALEDSRPGARVRAYDWLLSNGIEVPDYDPLGPTRDRRTALRAWSDPVAAPVDGERPGETQAEGEPR